jgi:miniconductance mechanosensitive channel
MLTSIQNLPLLLVQNGSPDGEVVLGALVALVFTIILALVAYLVTRTILLRFVVRAISRARANWGEILLERKVFHLLSLIAPAVVIGVAVPFVLEGYDRWIALS